MKSKKGSQAVAWVLVTMIFLALVGAGFVVWKTGILTQESAVGEGTISQSIIQASEASKSGNIATIGVYVRNLANNDINTKIAVATYCVDDLGTMIIDSTASSTSAEITGKTSVGRTVTCYAFNTTVQTKTPTAIPITQEYTHIVVDAYLMSETGKILLYDDSLKTSTGNGTVNVTGVGASQTGTLQKLRVQNNNTDRMYPLGGIYFPTVSGTNISSIIADGSATLSGMSQTTTQIVESTLSTKVGTRTDNWENVFEVDSDSSKAGNQFLLMEENDYLETGIVSVSGDGDGCSGYADTITAKTFIKGYSRSTKAETILADVAETDADSSAVLLTDWALDSATGNGAPVVYCRN